MRPTTAEEYPQGRLLLGHTHPALKKQGEHSARKPCAYRRPGARKRIRKIIEGGVASGTYRDKTP